MLGRVLKDLWRAWQNREPSRAPLPPTAGPRSSPTVLRYRPDVFDVADEKSARRIILTPEGGDSTESRWDRETPWIVRLASRELALNPRTRVLDYGCGIGRIAKGVIESTGCMVTGVDISASMRGLAIAYVSSGSFEALDPVALDARNGAGMQVDAAIACWVLQHCMSPDVDIARLLASLRPGGRLLVVNNHRRAVPGDDGWVDDDIDIAKALDACFLLVRRGTLDAEVAGIAVSQHSFFAIYERR
ncbi:MAG: class I SAM-dependent methyltransferase [Betaproteobacteria bacterium]